MGDSPFKDEAKAVGAGGLGAVAAYILSQLHTIPGTLRWGRGKEVNKTDAITKKELRDVKRRAKAIGFKVKKSLFPMATDLPPEIRFNKKVHEADVIFHELGHAEGFKGVKGRGHRIAQTLTTIPSAMKLVGPTAAIGGTALVVGSPESTAAKAAPYIAAAAIGAKQIPAEVSASILAMKDIKKNKRSILRAAKGLFGQSLASHLGPSLAVLVGVETARRVAEKIKKKGGD